MLGNLPCEPAVCLMELVRTRGDESHRTGLDAAWKQIEGNFGSEPHVIEEARYRLANAILSVASEDSRNVEALKRGALEHMARAYRDRLALGAPFSG